MTRTRPACSSPAQIAEAVPAYADLLDTIETQFPGATEREQFQESVRHLIDDLVSGLIKGTVAAVKAAEVGDIEAVRRHPSRLARFTPETRETSLQLKRFLLRNVYSSDALEKDRRDSIAKLDRLFEYLLEHPEKIPGGDAAEQLTAPGGLQLHRRDDRPLLPALLRTRSFNLPPSNSSTALPGARCSFVPVAGTTRRRAFPAIPSLRARRRL